MRRLGRSSVRWHGHMTTRVAAGQLCRVNQPDDEEGSGSCTVSDARSGGDELGNLKTLTYGFST
jgi:hypothetical protein